MSRYPYGHDELDRGDESLDEVARRLERYADERRANPPMDLATRIRATIADEPDPALGWWAGLAAWRAPAQALAAAAVIVAAVMGAMALGQLADRARQDDVGSSPIPSLLVSPSPSPTPTPSPSASASSTPSVSPSPSPTASDDDGEVETPEPSESDNSGPGGGGGDNSGPGGGG